MKNFVKLMMFVVVKFVKTLDYLVSPSLVKETKTREMVTDEYMSIVKVKDCLDLMYSNNQMSLKRYHREYVDLFKVLSIFKVNLLSYELSPFVKEMYKQAGEVVDTLEDYIHNIEKQLSVDDSKSIGATECFRVTDYQLGKSVLTNTIITDYLSSHIY